MSWNPNQGQDPNQPSQYGGYGGYSTPPQQPTDPYSQPNPQNPYQQGSYQQGQQNPYGAGQQQYSSYQPPAGAATSASQSGPTSMGMQPNIAAGLSYVVTWLTGIIFFLMEKQNRFVRFHAMQSILFFGGITVLEVAINIVDSIFAGLGVLGFLSLGLSCLGGIVGLVAFVGWIVLMINGFQGKYFKLPVVGNMAERYANQGIPGMPGV